MIAFECEDYEVVLPYCSSNFKEFVFCQSIVSRVKDSVKDMLAPSWLVDLVASVKKRTPPQSPEPSHSHQPLVYYSSLYTH